MTREYYIMILIRMKQYFQIRKNNRCKRESRDIKIIVSITINSSETKLKITVILKQNNSPLIIINCR